VYGAQKDSAETGREGKRQGPSLVAQFDATALKSFAKIGLSEQRRALEMRFQSPLEWSGPV
jgi:hypothetical protein